MIVFLNFAPIQYMGGAERKIYELFLNANKKEKSFIITIHKKLADVYGKAILNQKFDDRSNGILELNKNNSLQLSVKYFLPFTKLWKETRKQFQEARVIYIKSEVLEFSILFYFCGLNILKKVVAGVRSPWIYPTPLKTMDYIHNFVYKSYLMKIILQQTKFIHVLTTRDKEFFEKVFMLKNVIYIPNYIEIPDIKNLKKVSRDENELRIIFIGELLQRKGIETLTKVIKSSPKNFIFDIVGEGPMKQQILDLSKEFPNCTYHGYLEKKRILNLLHKNDVLFFPSYAEGFGNVIIEAMSVGLKIVDSSNISLNLPKNIEYSIKSFDSKNYINVFKLIYSDKKAGKDNKDKIQKYCSDHYKTDKIMPQLLTKLFNLKIQDFKYHVIGRLV